MFPGGALRPPPRIPMGCLRSAELIYELLERKTKIGRGNNCDVVLTTSKSISSAHAVILFSGPLQATLRDLNSTNGTFVNNVRVHNDSYPLESGDILRFGCDVQSYRFELGGDMPEYAPGQNGATSEDKNIDHTSRGRERAAGANTHRVRRSDSPASLSPIRGAGRELGRREAPHLRASSGNVGMNEDGSKDPRSPMSPPPVPRFRGNESDGAGMEVEYKNQHFGPTPVLAPGESQAQLSLKLARAEGERRGRLEAELEDLKKRLAESDGRSMGIAEYRREARALLRRERKRIGSGSEDEEHGPDSDLMVYRTAHGVIRESSPSRRYARRENVEDKAFEGDPFEYADNSSGRQHSDSKMRSGRQTNRANDPASSPQLDIEDHKVVPAGSEEPLLSERNHISYQDDGDLRERQGEEDSFSDSVTEMDRSVARSQLRKLEHHHQEKRSRLQDSRRRESESRSFRDSIDEDHGELEENIENKTSHNMKRSNSSPVPKRNMQFHQRKNSGQRSSKALRQHNFEKENQNQAVESEKLEDAHDNASKTEIPVEEEEIDPLEGFDVDGVGDQALPDDLDLLEGAAMAVGDQSLPQEPLHPPSANREEHQDQLALIEQLRQELAEVRKFGRSQEARLKEMSERQNKMIIAAEAAATARTLLPGNRSKRNESDEILITHDVEQRNNKEMLENTTLHSQIDSAEDDVVESSLSTIKGRLDASLKRRGELRDTIGALSESAVAVCSESFLLYCS